MASARTAYEQVTLGKPVHGGACLSHAADGRTLFVRGGLPGEVVKVRLSSEHKRFAWADVVEVIEPSRHRVPHIWPEAAGGGVGGVELGHVEPSYQRDWKGQVLTEQLQRIGGEKVVEQVLDVTGAQEGEVLVPVRPTPGDSTDEMLLGRRTRLQLVVNAQGKPGMRKYRSHSVVPLRSLPIASEEIASLNVLTDPAWKKRWVPGERIAVEAPNGSLPVVVTSAGTFSDPQTPGPEVSQWEVDTRYGTHVFPVRPGAFWQTHREAPSVLVEAVIEAMDIAPSDVVVELYAGSGLFSRFIADRLTDGELLTLEGNSDAVDSAGSTLGDAVEAGRAQVFQGTVDRKGVEELIAEARGAVTTVLADPPRTGAEKAVVKAICASPAKRVVLVSCDPASGARDLADFVEGGFVIESISAWDLFPHTHHFEMVTALVRPGSRPRRS